eukprot:7315152-Pyramimonas_sp.AAC.1
MRYCGPTAREVPARESGGVRAWASPRRLEPGGRGGSGGAGRPRPAGKQIASGASMALSLGPLIQIGLAG